MTAVFFASLDRLREVLSPQARVYELLTLETTLGGKTTAMSCEPRQFVLRVPER